MHEHYPEKDIFVLNTGTKNNMPFFIKILTHFKIKQHVIHDSDRRAQYDKNGKIKLKKNFTPVVNSAWTLNKTIWAEIEKCNRRFPGIVRRYVSIQNFEDSHNYSHSSSKGKPLSAWEFAQELDIDGEASIVQFIKQIVGEQEYKTDFSQYVLERIVVE